MSRSLKTVSLDDLASLNDEIVMLARAGLPVEAGLRRYAADNRRAADVAQRLADRLASGQALAECVQAESGAGPSLYASMIAAGIRSGRLDVALESFSELARDFADLRRSLLQAVAYPLLTLIAAYGLFVVFVAQLVRRLVFFTGGVTAESGWPIRLLMAVVDSMPNWVWVPPVLLLLVVVAWIAGGRAAAVSTTGWNRILCLLPGLSGVLQYFRHSMFAQLTATLLEHQVPFAEAMQLAGASVGNDLFRASVALAEADARGDRGAASAQSLRGMRPLMAWMLRREQAADQLISGLRHAASTYRERAADRVRWIRFVLPIFLVVVVAGGVTMLYGVSLFLPVSHTLQQLGEMSR